MPTMLVQENNSQSQPSIIIIIMLPSNSCKREKIIFSEQSTCNLARKVIVNLVNVLHVIEKIQYSVVVICRLITFDARSQDFFSHQVTVHVHDNAEPMSFDVTQYVLM